MNRVTTPFAEQEKLVPGILSLFGEILDEVYVTPEEQQDLRTTIDLAVHFYFYLKERASEPLDISSDEIDDFLLDLTANRARSGTLEWTRPIPEERAAFARVAMGAVR